MEYVTAALVAIFALVFLVLAFTVLPNLYARTFMRLMLRCMAPLEDIQHELEKLEEGMEQADKRIIDAECIADSCHRTLKFVENDPSLIKSQQYAKLSEALDSLLKAYNAAYKTNEEENETQKKEEFE